MDSGNKPRGTRYPILEELVVTDATAWQISELKEENARLRRELTEAKILIEKLMVGKQ